MGDGAGYGHGDNLSSRLRPPDGECGARHPVLRDVCCTEQEEHGGKHVAHMETETTAVRVEWGDEEIERAE